MEVPRGDTSPSAVHVREGEVFESPALVPGDGGEVTEDCDPKVESEPFTFDGVPRAGSVAEFADLKGSEGENEEHVTFEPERMPLEPGRDQEAVCLRTSEAFGGFLSLAEREFGIAADLEGGRVGG
jgi:hypothetical protein